MQVIAPPTQDVISVESVVINNSGTTTTTTAVTCPGTSTSTTTTISPLAPMPAFIAAYELVNNVAIYTKPGVDPAYSVIEGARIGTGNGGTQENVGEFATVARFEVSAAQHPPSTVGTTVPAPITCV
jgi:hypothetical protein